MTSHSLASNYLADSCCHSWISPHFVRGWNAVGVEALRHFAPASSIYSLFLYMAFLDEYGCEYSSLFSGSLALLRMCMHMESLLPLSSLIVHRHPQLDVLGLKVQTDQLVVRLFSSAYCKLFLLLIMHASPVLWSTRLTLYHFLVCLLQFSMLFCTHWTSVDLLTW